MQQVPYSQYIASPTYTGTNDLWIKGAQDWTQYAVVPQGATVTLLAVSPPTGGNGDLNFVDSDGQSYTYNYFFYPNRILTFHADIPGQHMLSFFVNGKLSNTVTIDVTGAYTPPSNYLPLPNYYPGYNQGSIRGTTAIIMAIMHHRLQQQPVLQ